MSTRTIGIVIRREYLNKVKKKSFLLITFIVPVLFAAMCVVPALIMRATKEEAKSIAVIDHSGIVLPYLQNNETLTFVDHSTLTLDEAKSMIGGGEVDVVLNISALDSTSRTVSAETYSSKPIGLDTQGAITAYINDAIEDYRINQVGIEDLKTIMSEVKSDVTIRTITLDETGKESITESGIFMVVSLVLGMIIYMFVAMFSGMVMSSVIEEKSSRVVEVLISSVKAIDLMFGKIIGVALVALTQFVLWIVLIVGILGITGAVVGADKVQELMGAGDVTAMVDPTGMSTDMDAMMSAAQPSEVGVIVSTLANMPLVEILVAFVLFFIFGYLLYASLFAAIGSAVENEADSSQLQLPLTIPLIVGLLIAMYAFKAPDSQMVFWTSMFPFTSPIVMLARLPFGVPLWQLIVSLVLLVLTFVVSAWASARIYKAGILQFGKKNGWADLWKWLKMR